jgi:hypothetical protein
MLLGLDMLYGAIVAVEHCQCAGEQSRSLCICKHLHDSIWLL